MDRAADEIYPGSSGARVANICICGHSQGNHMADSPHPCLVGDCKCMTYSHMHMCPHAGGEHQGSCVCVCGAIWDDKKSEWQEEQPYPGFNKDLYPETLPVRGPDDIVAWWDAVAGDDATVVVEKLGSYGSLNFHAICMLLLVGRPHASTREGTELAIASYIAGKLNRILASLSHGVLPEEDSWADLARYAMMARYVRKYGEWP